MAHMGTPPQKGTETQKVLEDGGIVEPTCRLSIFWHNNPDIQQPMIQFSCSLVIPTP